jgi:hypothetical protein
MRGHSPYVLRSYAASEYCEIEYDAREGTFASQSSVPAKTEEVTKWLQKINLSVYNRGVLKSITTENLKFLRLFLIFLEVKNSRIASASRCKRCLTRNFQAFTHNYWR